MTADANPGPGRSDAALYQCEGDPEGADWAVWRVREATRFNGQFGVLRTRLDGARAIVRFEPHDGLANVSGALHGGAIMTMVDMAMFIGGRALGCKVAPFGVTVDLSVQFVGAGNVVEPVDAIVEITRETGRLLFVRGTVEQGCEIVSSYVGILRKPGERPQ